MTFVLRIPKKRLPVLKKNLLNHNSYLRPLVIEKGITAGKGAEILIENDFEYCSFAFRKSLLLQVFQSSIGVVWCLM